MPDTISETTIVAADEEVVSCELGGGVALLDLRSSTYYNINAVGTEVWEVIQKPASVKDIRDHLVSRFDVDPEVCFKDLVALLGHMAKVNLVKINDAVGS